MAIFKCKMCGGSIEYNNESVAVCEYCATKQTLPRLDDERKVNLYDRANHFRRNNEFDKAMAIYEQVLNTDPTDSESYWSIVLCRFGIEYVEDPSAHKRLPTINRAQFTSVFDDEDYRSAIKYADPVQKEIYEAEAAAINEIQKGILAISQREEPFDVFICYKETDQNGRRTPDSVLATELYNELTREGFKVFFARITLEDKLGQEYEPYIFAALNSAKVMVVLGTKPEHFNAVWVKNEWSRYLSLIRNGERKMLIPAYKDMDPYDLPEEFSHLQAQDMSRLGFMQDLVRGIGKIVAVEAPAAKAEPSVNSTSVGVAPLLDRAELFIEDGDFESADEYAEKVLDQEPRNAEAYLIKLLVDLKLNNKNDLADCGENYSANQNYQKLLRFSDEESKARYTELCKANYEAAEEKRLRSVYNEALGILEKATNENTVFQAARMFEGLGDYADSKEMHKSCAEKAKYLENLRVYNDAKSSYGRDTVWDMKRALAVFQKLGDFKDSAEYAKKCEERIAEIEHEEKKQRIRDRIIGLSFLGAVVIICICVYVFSTVVPKNKYEKAMELMADREYSEAYEILRTIKYEDSVDQADLAYFCALVTEAKPYDSIQYGGYSRPNDISGYSEFGENGEALLTWQVYDLNNDKYLLICEQEFDNTSIYFDKTSIYYDDYNDISKYTGSVLFNDSYNIVAEIGFSGVEIPSSILKKHNCNIEVEDDKLIAIVDLSDVGK